MLALVLLAAESARAQDEAPLDPEEPSVPSAPPWRIKLTPPNLRHDATPKVSGLDLAARAASPHTHPLHLSLDLSVSALRLAVHGDYRPGFAPFLGTSTAALGGLRLRF